LTSAIQRANNVPAGAQTPVAPVAPEPGSVPASVPSGWVATTDEPSGFSVALPSTPKVGDQAFDNVHTRYYAAAVPGHHASVVFGVQDLPPDAGATDATSALDDSLSAINDSVSQVTSAQHLVVDGRPTLDGQLSTTLDGQPATELVRYQLVGEHIVTVLSTGLQSDEPALTTMHQQVLSTADLQLSR
jgi:hypothetical protein